MEKERLVDFISTIMEDSGFKIKKEYEVANQVVDIYGVLPSTMGSIGVVVACKNYEEPWKIGLDVLKDMEIAGRAVHASKIIIFTTSSYTHGAAVYAQKRNIKLVDRKGLIKIAKNYAQKRTIVTEPIVDEDDYDDYYYEGGHNKPVSLSPKRSSSHNIFSGINHGHSNSSNTSYQSSSSRKRNYLNPVNSNITNKVSFDINGFIEFFTKHATVYLVLLILISTIISYILNTLTSGPYTGVGKIATSAIVCFGGLLLVNKNLSDVLFKGSIIFFISIIISIAMLTV